jgi:hypothetical protein
MERASFCCLEDGAGLTTELTRRRDPDAREERWLVYFGDVRVGTVEIRSGNPHVTWRDQEAWTARNIVASIDTSECWWIGNRSNG